MAATISPVQNLLAVLLNPNALSSRIAVKNNDQAWVSLKRANRLKTSQKAMGGKKIFAAKVKFGFHNFPL